MGATGATRVIVVDDTEEIRQILRFTLELEGYEVLEASNGEEALAYEYQPGDVMLLDVMMPVCSGWEVLGALVHREEAQRPRVIMLTAKGGERNRQVALSLEAVAFISKPFDPDDVIREVERVLSAEPDQLTDDREHQIYISRMLTLLERGSSNQTTDAVYPARPVA